MGARELVCRTNLARKRWDLTQRNGIRLRKQAVVFKRREGRKPHSGMLALQSASWRGPGFFRRWMSLSGDTLGLRFLDGIEAVTQAGRLQKSLDLPRQPSGNSSRSRRAAKWSARLDERQT